MSQLVIFTCQPDTHVDLVLSLIPSVKYVVIDPSSYPNLDMTYSVLLEGDINIINKTMLNDVKVVWYRKPYFGEEIGSNYPSIYRDSIRNNYESWIEYYYSIFGEAFWISPRYSISRANSKILQSQVAREIGFAIPRALFTSNLEHARNFITQGFDTVIKPVYTDYVNINGKYKTMFTNDVDVEKTDLSGISKFPCIIQEKIYGIDYRVTVVGDKIHMYQIIKKDRYRLNTDWRRFQLNKGLDYNYIEDIPSDLSEKCFKMVRNLGLNYGAFDFIQSVDGSYFFLELNPNGQWAFAEENTSGPITKSMAELILSKLS